MLIYDGDCGFCKRSLRWAIQLGAQCVHQPWQSADLDALGLTREQVQEAAWFVTDAGAWQGHEAIAQVLMTSKWLPVRVLGHVVGARVLRPVGERVYDWVARNRGRLP